MKKYLIFFILTVILLSLTACGNVTDLSTPPDPEAELAACRAVLEDFQSHDSYHVFSHTDYVSDWILNTFSDVHFWKNGTDWFLTSRPTDDSVFANLYKDGKHFNNDDQIGHAWEDDIKWNPAASGEERQPWLYSFDWDAQKVTHFSTAVSGDGRIVTILVHDTWDRGTSEYNLAESYTVDFHFNKNGAFEKAVLNLSFAEDGTETETETMTILSTDETEIAARINQEYQRALEQNGLGDSDHGEALAVCGAVLKELQSHDSYHFYEETKLAGNRFTKNTLRQGADWLFYNNVEADNFAAGYLSRNGDFFNTEMADERSKPGDLKWASVPGLPGGMEAYAPWLYTCDWDSQNVKLLSDTMKGGERIISVQIDTPYTYPGGNGPVAVGYTVDFRFDPNGDFMDAMMCGSFHYEDPMLSEYDYFLKEKISILSTDPDEVAAKIDHEYQRALEQNNML